MNIVAKPYESLLPFLVAEAISHKPSFNAMSVRMMDKGWAWLVNGRKLLIWKFKESSSTTMTRARRMLSPCFELQLPQSDIVHKAELIDVFFMPQNPNTSIRAITVPAALTISPEGTIRLWSNIANERYTETSVTELQGQEFCTLSSLSTLEYLLGTTTGSVFLLSIDINSHDSRGLIVCSALAAPSGLLSGISRRMTTLFFGPLMSDISADIRRPLITVPKYSQSTIDRTGSTDRIFFVLSSSMKLRHWSRTNQGVNSTNQLVREWDLQKSVHSELASKLGSNDAESISFWPVDMITTKSKDLFILIVTLDSASSNVINYATCLFNPYQASESITNLTILRSHSYHYTNETEEQLLALRFLERRLSSPYCFMYDRKFLFLIQADQDILDAVDYGNQDDGILGTGIVDNQAIIFTQRDGLTYVTPVPSNKSRADLMNETSIQLDLPANSIRQNTSYQPASSRSEPMQVEPDADEDLENRQTGDADQSCRSNDRSRTEPPKRRPDELVEFLRENKEFEWIQLIESKQYRAASELLSKLAQESDKLADRRETLLALSKLALLAE